MVEDRVELARHLQELASNALGAAVVQVLGGWRLRFAHGYSRRANCVLPDAHDGRVGVAEKLVEVEAFYARHGLPARVQLSPASEPKGLDDLLQARGYRYERPTEVQVAPVGEVLARLRRAAAQERRTELELSPGLQDAWLETSQRATGRGAATAVLAALARWAGSAGASRLYLQVEADNPGAIALYRQAGFRPAYTYHYRSATLPEEVTADREPSGAR